MARIVLNRVNGIIGDIIIMGVIVQADILLPEG